MTTGSDDTPAEQPPQEEKTEAQKHLDEILKKKQLEQQIAETELAIAQKDKAIEEAKQAVLKAKQVVMTKAEQKAEEAKIAQSELATAQAAKAKAEAEQAQAVAEQTKLKELFPSEGITKATGSITIGADAGYIAELAAYKAMECVAQNIADVVNKKGGKEIKGILLTDSLEYGYSDVQAVKMSLQLKSLGGLLEEQKNKIKNVPEIGEEEKKREMEMVEKLGLDGGFGAALTAAPHVIGAMANILSYFQMDYSVTGKAVQIADDTLRAMVAGHINYPVYLTGFHNIELQKSPILSRLEKCIKDRDKLQQLMGKLNAIITAQEAAAGSEAKDKGKSPNELLYAESKSLFDAFNSFVEKITKVEEGKTHAPLDEAVIREYLNEYMRKNNISHLLHLKVGSSKGEYITRKWLFNIIAKIWYMGGCVVSYVLAESNGKILASDSVSGLSHLRYIMGTDHLPDFTTSIAKSKAS
jgi:hypothetical protein